MKVLQEENIEIEGGSIPILLLLENDESDRSLYYVKIDGIQWLETDNGCHAGIIFRLLADHVTEYMIYRKLP